MICYSYSNVLHLPIFGYGAKTISRSTTSASFFPLSSDLRNPFVSNEVDVINQQYTDCLKKLELAIPVKLSPLFQFIKNIGQKVKFDMDKNNREAQFFYVVYILSAGLIDDIQEVI